MNDSKLHIRLFTKSYCGWCHEAIDWLRGKGLAFEELEVLSNPAAMEELKDLTGKTMTPTIEVNGDIQPISEWMSWSLGGRNTALIAECNLLSP